MKNYLYMQVIIDWPNPRNLSTGICIYRYIRIRLKPAGTDHVEVYDPDYRRHQPDRREPVPPKVQPVNEAAA